MMSRVFTNVCTWAAAATAIDNYPLPIPDREQLFRKVISAIVTKVGIKNVHMTADAAEVASTYKTTITSVELNMAELAIIAKVLYHSDRDEAQFFHDAALAVEREHENG